MKNKLTVLAVAVGLFMVSVPMFAHHGGGLYDREHPITLAGTVTEFRFINPHVQILFDVKDENGNVVKWIGVTAPVRRMYKFGWTTKTLKPGDQITITGGPRNDGRKVLSIKKLRGPSGRELTELGAQ